MGGRHAAETERLAMSAELLAALGSFDCAAASLREAATALRMTASFWMTELFSATGMISDERDFDSGLLQDANI
jgi:hypothetical protein